MAGIALNISSGNFVVNRAEGPKTISRDTTANNLKMNLYDLEIVKDF